MMTKLEIKVPHMESAVYEFDVQAVDLGDDILYEDYIYHLYEAFDTYLYQTMGLIDIMGLKYDPSDVLKATDEIAYRCLFIDWMSYTMEYANEAIETYGYTIIGDIEINLISDSEEEEE